MNKSVSEQMAAILDDYGDDVKDIYRKNAKKSARAASKELRNVAPKRTGDYAVGWTSTNIDEDTTASYNRKMPGLTHLLEYGHVTRNKRGEFGRTPAHPHIKQVEAEMVEQYVANVIRELQKR